MEPNENTSAIEMVDFDAVQCWYAEFHKLPRYVTTASFAAIGLVVSLLSLVVGTDLKFVIAHEWLLFTTLGFWAIGVVAGLTASGCTYWWFDGYVRLRFARWFKSADRKIDVSQRLFPKRARCAVVALWIGTASLAVGILAAVCWVLLTVAG